MEIGKKNNKNEKCRKKKRTFWQELLAQLCSQIVSFFLFLCFFQFCIFAENTIKIGVSTKKDKHKQKINKILKLKGGPS